MAIFWSKAPRVELSSPSVRRLDAPTWSARLVTLVTWALVAASGTFWFLHQPSESLDDAQSAATPASGSAPPMTPHLTQQVALALGAKNQTPTNDSTTTWQKRLQLLGVYAVGTKRGAALIALDGKPAKPYAVGHKIDDEGPQILALQERSVLLGDATVTFSLELPLQK